MTSKTKLLDLAGLTVIVKDIEIGATKANTRGTALSSTELAYLDGITAGTGLASKAVILDSSSNIILPGKVLTSSGVGTVTTSATTTAEEYGNGIDHTTKLTLTAFAVGTGDDNANLAIGAQVYTFGSGALMIMDSSISGIFDQASHGTISAGEVALGTVVGSGANATLSSTMENIFDGGVNGVLSSYVLGTTVVNAGGSQATALKIATAGTKSVFLNIAAAWPNIAAAEAVTFTGVITLRWRKIS